MLLFTVCIGIAIGQDQVKPVPMTNSEVVKLVKGGISDELITKTINGRPSQFDLSADGLLDLKNSGVSDRVIEAMMSGQEAPTRSQDSVSSPSQFDSSFWLYDGDKKIRLQQTHVTVEAKAGLGTAFGGAAHAYATFSAGGPTAAIRITNRDPHFGEVLVPEDLRVEELVQLVKLEIDSASKHRRVQVAKVAAFRSTQSGIPEAARIPIIFEVVREVAYKGKPSRLYSFKPEAPLAPGEYAVVISNRLFLDFGID
jgi:hypothetical protein